MRLFTVTLAYAPSLILRAGIGQLYRTREMDDWHLIIDQHWPLDQDNVGHAIRELRIRHKISYIDPGKNLGYHGGFNAAMQFFGDIMRDEDAIVCYDPDSWPEQRGWDRAIFDVMRTRPQVATCGIMGPIGHREVRERGYTEYPYDYSGAGYWRPKQAIIASLQAWRVGFIRSICGFHEPNPFYGGIEAEMWAHLERKGLQWAVLPKFSDSDRLRQQKDPQYREWQWAHAHLKNFHGDFGEFLQSGMKVENIGEF